MPRIPFFTFGLLRENYEHPQIAGFWALGKTVFETAREFPGFLCRVEPDGGGAVPCFSAPVYGPGR